MRRGSAALAVSLLLLLAGCAREAPEEREVRLHARRYLAALTRKDLQEIRSRSTCVVSYRYITGARILKIGPARRITLGGLDSLAQAAAAEHRTADSLWGYGRGDAAEEAEARRERSGRLHILYRNAIRAASASRPDTLLGSNAPLETRTLRTRVRYAGALVGPKPIDRELLLRLLRAPHGTWIAFSFYLPEDDPRPGGV